MSFSGNLEHLPVVDVIQLLETTKKNGTLIVNNGNIVYKFGFENGYIVSVTHPDDRYSLSKMLVIKKLFNNEESLHAYEECLKNRQIFSEYLATNKNFSNQTLLNLLTSFVELTVVDILTWDKGTFQLAVENVEISDEFEYLSNISSRKIYISTQNVLMEALRIYDEWKRDGILKGGIFSHKVENGAVSTDGLEITEDLLGLDNLENLDRKIPNVFIPIKETDYINPHKKLVAKSFPYFSKEEQDKLAEFLVALDAQKSPKTRSNIAIVYYGNDAFDTHAINIICKSLNTFIFTTDSEENIEPIVNQSLSKSLIPIILVDGTQVELKNQYFAAKVMRIVNFENYESIYNYYEKGCLDVFPKPDKFSFSLTLAFLNALNTYIKNLNLHPVCMPLNFNQTMDLIKKSEKVSDIASYFAEFLACFFKRYVTIMIQKDAFIVEKIKGINLSGNVDIKSSRIITECMNQSKIYFGNYEEEIANLFYSNVEKPYDKTVCIVPLSGLNKTLYLVYADALNDYICFQHILLLQEYSNTAINALLYRKLFEKNKRTV